MKYKRAVIALAILICFLVLGSLGYMQAKPKGRLELSIESSKEVYYLGQTVLLSFKLKNESNEVVSIADKFGIGGGLLSVHLSPDGKAFQNYDHPGWGLADLSDPLTSIDPGESLETSASVLWKWKGSDRAAYAFPRAGQYFLKAQYAYDNVITNGQMKPVIAESEPIKITILEPEGDDLVVWNRIKNDPDFAYFIQEGDVRIPTYRDKERATFLEAVEKILTNHPTSLYAPSLKQSIDKLHSNEARRQELIQKLPKAH